MTEEDFSDPLADPRIQAIHDSLQGRPFRSATGQGEGDTDPLATAVPFASVALVVRPGPEDLEALLIRRAAFDGDPWSGHVALPGGRRHSTDHTPSDTAIRETREEVGIDLSAVGRMLGRLDDVRPRRGGPPISVAAFVFAVPAGTRVTPNYEVDSAFWVPVRHLADRASEIEHVHTASSGEQIPFPAIGYQDFVIWGLTHRILTQFCELTFAGD